PRARAPHRARRARARRERLDPHLAPRATRLVVRPRSAAARAAHLQLLPEESPAIYLQSGARLLGQLLRAHPPGERVTPRVARGAQRDGGRRGRARPRAQPGERPREAPALRVPPRARARPRALLAGRRAEARAARSRAR